VTYKRVTPFQRESGTPVGIIRGTLASDGEASDGHILSMRGAEIEPGIPLLFGHDAESGDRNLGSWIEFTKGAHAIRGEAAIELAGASGSGTLEWRQDMAHMIAQGHVSGLSVRWDPVDEPVRRVDLNAAHPAFVDGEREKNPMKRYGLFFPRWRAIEGSVVNLGADRKAVIGRAEAATEPTRAFWRAALVEVDEQARAEELEALIAKATALESLPAPSALLPMPALVSVVEMQEMFVRVAGEVIQAKLGNLNEQVRAVALEEFNRVRGKR
jgi:hypothetical protein